MIVKFLKTWSHKGCHTMSFLLPSQRQDFLLYLLPTLWFVGRKGRQSH